MAANPLADNFIELFKSNFVNAVLNLGESREVSNNVIDIKDGKNSFELIHQKMKFVDSNFFFFFKIL